MPPAAAAEDGLPQIELERQARIQRNRQVLCELGLEHAGQRLMAPPPRKRKAAKQQKASQQQQEQQPLQLARKSRRLQGDMPEVDVLGARSRQRELDGHKEGELQQPKRSRGGSSSRPAATGQQHDDQQYSGWDGWRMDTDAVEALLQREPDDPHHMHNIDRLRYMTVKSLVTRVRRITNVGKLRSFIKVLQAAGGPQPVLEAAQEALDDV